jgi:hypothetical protein
MNATAQILRRLDQIRDESVMHAGIVSALDVAAAAGDG